MTKKINVIFILCLLSVIFFSCSTKPSTNVAKAWIEKNFGNNIEFVKFDKVNGIESEDKKVAYYVMYFDATIKFNNDWIDNSPSYRGKEYKKGDEYKIDLGSINFMQTENGWIATTVNFKENNGFVKLANTANVVQQVSKPENVETTEKMPQTKEEKWQSFLDNFKNAVNSRDEEKIVELTSKNFFDGGGGETIREWLNNVILNDAKGHKYFQNMLKGSLKSYKNPDGSITRASGNNSNGDIYFVYEQEDWHFGGIVGD